MVNGLLPGLWQVAFAAVGSVNVSYDTYVNGTLNIKWDLAPARGVTIVTYHTPNTNDSANTINMSPILSTNTTNPNKASISGLKSDYIYDITVNVYDSDVLNPDGSAAGNLIATDTMYFLPQISFYSDIVNQQTVTNPGGGSETGVLPTLKLSWNMPKVYMYKDVNSVIVDKFVYANNVNAYNAIDPSGIVQNLNFIINISDNAQKSDIVVNYISTDGSYKVKISGDIDANASDVQFDSLTGKLYFYLLGVKEDGVDAATLAQIATASATPGQTVIPDDIFKKANEYKYILPDKEILPGTIYYLKLIALFTDATGGYVGAISYGVTANPLLGTLSYTYTPIRFELSKDSMDNINVKIYKVNKGNQSIPQLYYEVQLNSLPDDNDSTWNLVKKLDGLNFTGAFAYTVITGIGVNNAVYYRVVVKSNFSSDRMESMKMLYTLQTDTSKPPVPKNVMIEKRELVTNSLIDDKSTDVTISWDKPANWDQIMLNTTAANDIVYQILLNTYQSELDVLPNPPLQAGGNLYGYFPVKYRKMVYVSARSSDITVSGNRLIYKIKGFELFQGAKMTGYDNVANKPIIQSNVDFNPHEMDSSVPAKEYPNYLLPNTVYYLQMYTTKESDRDTTNTANMSDKSLTVSFTTLTGVERDVPLPDNFRLNKNDVDSSKINFLEVQFNKVKIDWNNYTSNHAAADAIYYDIYMSTRPDTNTFKLIGSTQFTDYLTNTDIAFDKVTDIQSLFITAKISKFSPGIGAYDDDDNFLTPDIDPNEIFGPSLMPNTTYYFYVKTRLVFVNSPTVKKSIATAILPVTTIRSDILPGDDTSRKPVAPIDFAIAKDAKGDLLLKGQAVTFSWTKQEDNVVYELICTSQRVASDADSSTYWDDPTFVSFRTRFGSQDFDGNNDRLVLDPTHTPTLQSNLEYNATTKICKFTINTWLFPNKLYYFTLRTIKQSNPSDKYSVWVSIPVTTSLIEGPSALAPVNDSELGFNWTDSVIDLTRKSEDYRVSIKGPKDSVYKVLTRAQAKIVIDAPQAGVTRFYGRIYNLASNSAYNVKVERAITTAGVTSYTTVFPLVNMNGLLSTKDDYHQLEVMWKGPPVDVDLSKYEIAVKTPEAADYTILDPNIDLEKYLDVTGTSTYPYYIEKTALTIGTSYSIFHVKIKSVPVTYSDGISQHEPLKSNTKYFIKVRAKKIDASNAYLISYSKFIGPIDTRTEFNQGDYDQIDEDLKEKASFLDKIAKLEKNVYWHMDMNNSNANKIMLKGDKLLNTIENGTGYSSTLDFSGFGKNINSDVIYMPVSIARLLNSNDKTLIVKTAGAEFTFRPRTLSIEDIQEIKTVQNQTGVTDLYLKLFITRIDKLPANEIAGNKNISKVNDFKIQVIGTSKTDKELRTLFHDKLYDDRTGLIKQKTGILSNSSAAMSTLTAQKTIEYINRLVREVESDLGDYINSTVEGSNGTTGVIVKSENIKVFSNPMLTKLSFNSDQGLKSPYVFYDGATAWQKLSNGVSITGNSMTFNTAKVGKYAVFAAASITNNLPADYATKDNINKFTSKYDLSDVFAGINQSFNPELNVSGKEIILLYEKVMNKTSQNAALDIKQKMKSLQLDTILNQNNVNKDVTKQEVAAIIIRVYASKMGVNGDSLKNVKNIFINDEKDISNKFYNSCVITLNLGVLALDEKSNFLPDKELTRAEIITAFEKVLELTGDIK